MPQRSPRSHRFPPRLAASALAAALATATAAAVAAAPAPLTLVVCAPGYPGSTAEAQPTMDAFAAAVAQAAGWAPGSLAAVYHESAAAGLARLGRNDAALALVPLPFYLEHRAALRLQPLLQAVTAGGVADEPWSLVAGKGKVAGAAGLDGFEIVGLPAYSPRFVRLALAGWGTIPASVTMTPSGAVLSAMRKAASGEKIAVLLDREQAAALPTLPFAAQLETVAQSPPLPVSVLCVVGARLVHGRAQTLERMLLGLAGSASGAPALAAMRLHGFVAADSVALRRAEQDFARQKP